MPRLIDMSALVLRSKQRADKVGDDHIGGSDTSEWNRLISEVWGADVFSVVAGTGLRYFETTADLVSDSDAYLDEPTNCLSVIRLNYVGTGGIESELDEVNAYEESFFKTSTQTANPSRYFALVDNRIYLYPPPASGKTYRLTYIPQAPDVSGYASDACVDVVTPDGEACLIWGVAALARAKASQDASFHMQQSEKYRERLIGWAAERVMAQPRRRVVRLDVPGDRSTDPAEFNW